MRYSAVVLSALLSQLAQGAVPPKQESTLPDVPQLKADTFDSFIEDSNLAMVKFFAPWCGYCVKMAEPYKLAGVQLKEKGVKAAVAEVDCTVEKELCAKHKISGYPSIKVFRAGQASKPSDYTLARDTETIVDYLRRQSLPAVNVLKADEVKGHVESFKTSLVVVANMPKSHAAYTAFEKAAEALRAEFSFALVEGKDNTITVFKNFDEGEVKWSKPLAEITEKALTQWLEEESIPLMDEISPNNYEKYINAKKPMAYLFYETEEQRKTYGEMVQKVMKPLKGKINAIYFAVKEFGEMATKHAKNMNMEPHWPGFVIHDVEKNLKYPMTGKDKAAPSVEALETFVKSFSEGKLEPHYKSEQVPDAAKEKSEKIKTVVYDSFDKVVLDKSKDVFLEIHAPWCGACKRIAPELDLLAEAYAPHSDKIIIAKLDGDANDLPRSSKFTIEHFPSLLLYKAGTNELVEMKHLGKLKDIHEFIKANAANKVDIDISKHVAPTEPEEEGSAPEESDAGEHDEL